MNQKFLPALIVFALFFSCNRTNRLPVYGKRIAILKASQIGNSLDSMDYTIPNFSLDDQDGIGVNAGTTRDQIFVAEFFFTACPSICPKMQAQMLRVYEKYKTNPDISILAFSIDPERDSVQKLHTYAEKLEVVSSKWHFLTGNKDSIFSLAEKFLVSASEDPDAPGGHVHSGNFILVDKHRRIRGYYDGTNPESVKKLLQEIDILQQEMEDERLQDV